MVPADAVNKAIAVWDLCNQVFFRWPRHRKCYWSRVMMTQAGGVSIASGISLAWLAVCVMANVK